MDLLEERVVVRHSLQWIVLVFEAVVWRKLELMLSESTAEQLLTDKKLEWRSL